MLLIPIFLIGCADFDGKVVTPLPIIEEKIYYFDEIETGEPSGALVIAMDHEGKLSAKQLETFISKNFNGSYGVHPTVSMVGLEVLSNGRYVIDSKDIDYSSTNDLEKDESTVDLSNGKHYTIYELEIDSDRKLMLTIKIYDGSLSSSGSINNLVITRIFKEI